MRKKRSLVKELMESRIPFNRFLGMRVRAISRGRAVLVLPYRDEFLGDTQRPALHGGVISTLIDTAGGAAAFTETEEGDRLATVDLLVDYLAPAQKGALEADARVKRIGNRMAVVHVSVRQEGRDEIVAMGRAVYNIVRRK